MARTEVPPALLHALGQASRTPTTLAFERAVRAPMKAQRERLDAALAQSRGTAYAKHVGLDAITTPEEYRRRAPVMTSADLKGWVARQLAGEQAVLTQEKPVYFVRTTGSTGTPKHVPITPAYKGEFQKTVHVALWHLFRRFPAAFRGRALYFVGSRRVAETRDGTGIGTMSGFNFTELPPVVRAIYAWPYELFEVKDLETRSYLALHLACLRDVSLIAGIFPAPIVSLLRDLETRADELGHHLGRGTLPEWLRLDPGQRAFFAEGLRPREDLRARLRRAERVPLEEKALAAMPKLRLVYCWTSATAGLYVPELQRRVGPEVAVRDAIYSACEAWCSSPMGEAEPGGPFAITSHFFELVPEELAESVDDPRDLPASAFRTIADVRDGERYYLVPTTSGGLYRYWLGDVVEICGRYRNTPRLRFVRKGGAATNLVGEKLDEAHVSTSVGRALDELGLEHTWFMVTPSPREEGGTPSYTLHVELPQGFEGGVLEQLRAAVDRALRTSFDFERVRAAEHLGPLQIRALAPGSYARHVQRKVAAGSAEAQLKIAHLGEALPEGLGR